ncbi:hypothetical protein GFS31_41690 (plasmid) [Leptolyngbya sp. BL0902]|uniref:hypothetical protein n=1 Tax=Leptolyngbya sp. BL0902 TaxID=1115757 RepID=UPI0018E73A9F|nr:hypothetical protein [Leptolyngbya sp. BL0902]QQE67456.1 hypothetical protein GFS31_41690 [Leptolyngbya sp. BL0902]
MTLNRFETFDLDEPLPIVVLVIPAREPFVIRGHLTPTEAEIARRLAPNPQGYRHPTEGWVSEGWPA